MSFSPIKINKSTGYDEIIFNVIKNCIGKLCDLFKYIFSLTFKKGIFPDYMKKIAKVPPIFKGGNSAYLSNYRPISVLHAFLKFLND